MPRNRRPGIGAALLVVMLALGATSVSCSSATGATARPGHLTVDGVSAPIGLSVSDVRFGWQLGDGRRAAVQAAYRIVVSRRVVAGRDRGKVTTAWDSGRVASATQAFVTYGGPPLASDAVYQWTVQTWPGSGGPSRFAPPSVFETGLENRDWRASWIRRAADDQAEPDQYSYARNEVRLSGSPIVRARAYVSADQQYELYVNGSRAGKGEAYSYPDAQYYETLDVTRLLRAGGLNAIGVVSSWQGATKGHPAGTPGVIVQMSVVHGDGSTEMIATDGSWRVRKGAWLPGSQRDLEGDLVDYTERIDGRNIPIGWDHAGFDDHAWKPASVLGPAGVAPWTSLVSVRTRIVEEPVFPVSLARLASGAVVADFGKVYAAVPAVTFHRGVAGRVINIRAGYLLDEARAGQPIAGEPGQVSRQRGTQHTDMSYSYTERGGVESFHAFDYLGFRYLEISSPGEPLARADVVALTRHSAVPDEHAATFHSSNPTVDAVFELGRHSALFTAQEQFIDTPTREKGPWLWDGFNESQTAMAAFGEQNLTRKSLIEFAQSQARYWPNGAVSKIYPTGLDGLDINEFAEIYPEWVWQYWLRTGDQALLGQVYPVLVKLSGYVNSSIASSTGLVTNLPSTSVYYDFPVVTRLNVLGVNVFRRAADVGTILGRPATEIAEQRDRQSALSAALNQRLTRADGTYADGLHADGSRTVQASQDTNACAVVYGVVPSDRQARVAAYIAGLGMSAPPRTAGEVLEALALTHRDDDVVRRITDSTTDGWASILAHGGTFTWEVWQPSDDKGDSMSHGWGANVLVEIQHALLGARLAGPGGTSIAVAPPRSGLAWASGTVPTPNGQLVVAWRQPTRADPAFTLDLTVPANAVATVRIPAVSPAVVTEGRRPLNGAKGVRFVELSGGDVVLRVAAGTYHFRSVQNAPTSPKAMPAPPNDVPGGLAAPWEDNRLGPRMVGGDRRQR